MKNSNIKIKGDKNKVGDEYYNYNNTYYNGKIPTPPEFTKTFELLYDLITADDEQNCIKENTQLLDKLLHQDEGYITNKINYNNLSDTTDINDMSSNIMSHFNISDTDLFVKTKANKVNSYLRGLYTRKYKNHNIQSKDILNNMIYDLINMVEKSSYNMLGEDYVSLCISYLVYNAVLNCKVLEPAPENYREN